MGSLSIDTATAVPYRPHPIGGAHQRARRRAVLHSGYTDEPALTLQSADGDHPNGRELSFAWLVGTVMTGLTSVLLMGAALYVSFQGQATFSTPYEALEVAKVERSDSTAPSDAKQSRVRPVAATRSDLEVVEASIRETADGRSIIRSQSFTRLAATLATVGTVLSEDIPEYDPAALLETIVTSAPQAASSQNTDIYGTTVEGEVAVTMSPLPRSFVPAPAISDSFAANLVASSLDDVFAVGGGDIALGYAPSASQLTDLEVSPDQSGGIAENVTVVPKTKSVQEGGGRAERVVTIRDGGSLSEALLKNGFDAQSYALVAATLQNVLPNMTLPRSTKLRILMGPSRTSSSLVPHRLSIYFADAATNEVRHAATAALTDRGGYVIGLEPGTIDFPEEDTEEINVASLPTLYRAIWETGRKHEIDDPTISRLVAMFAYDVDLTKKVEPGDTIKLLRTRPEAGTPELLYAALTIGGTTRELYRYRSSDGFVDFYSPEGETGKRFLTRRPLQGGGRLASRFGYRIHPIFKSRRLHSGVDLAAPYGTPVYAGGDGTVKRAQWVSGYGRYVELDHVNGYQTGYAHMSRIAEGLKPGMRVKQGQIVGYVGSTGNSTGNHLHYEVRVNGRPVDALSIKLPRDRQLAAQEEAPFLQTATQIRELMTREPSEVLME
jgi:murein DD-endopeptidase MepM/ murein hydrolase activator NlpD/cytoskeletal protein RodZ